MRQQLQQQERNEERLAAQQQQQQDTQSPFALYAAAAADSGKVSGSQQQQQQRLTIEDPAAGTSIRIPRGVVLGSSSSGTGYMTAAAAAAISQPEIQPSAIPVQDHQQQQQQQGSNTSDKGESPALDQRSPQRVGALSAQFKLAKAESLPLSRYDSVRSDSPGFEDAYLDPPMPSSDQLSLFTEVQRLVTEKGFGPVLHCVVQRMLFAMPFDDRIKITLDTDVRMSAVVSYLLGFWFSIYLHVLQLMH